MRVPWSQLTLLDIFKTWKTCEKLSRDHQKLSRPSGNFPDYPETFQTIRKLSRPSGNFPDHPESFQTIQKLSRLSGNFPDHLETFQTIRKVSRPSGNLCFWTCLLMVDFIDTRKNFPGGNATIRHGFFWLCPTPTHLRLWEGCGRGVFTSSISNYRLPQVKCQITKYKYKVSNYGGCISYETQT